MAYPRTPTLLAGAVLLLTVATATSSHAQFSVLHNFGTKSGDGTNPSYSGIVAQGRDGNMYSTTGNGGTNNLGTVFKVTPAGTLTVIYSFDGTHGSEPYGGLTLGTDGNFYGTAFGGGKFSYGTVFKITPGGSLTVLFNFTGGNDGSNPHAPPIEGTDGNFYGTTRTGGTHIYYGTVYKITPSGLFTTLYSFDVTPHGDYPVAPLVQGTDGNFYGTTVNGGASNQGIVFRITSSGKLTVLYSFGTTGSQPYSPIIQGTDGNFYGTTAFGGSAGGGIAFKITPTGKLTVLYNFGVGSGPAVPYAGLVQATDGLFYGNTYQGGTMGDGTIFRMSAIGQISSLYDFDSTTGAIPEVTLLQHTNGILYGDTYEGGTSKPACGNVGCGVFYRWNAGLKPFVSLVSTSGKIGKTIEILGQGFTGTTGVSFNGVAATFTFVSGTYLTAVVPTGATTGSVTVKTPGGTLTSNKTFRVTPVILSFSPTSGKVDTSVVITGNSLLQTNKVTFGGVKATTFTVNSNSQVKATVPTGAVTGKIGVTTSGGSATSSGTFTVLP
jgi:uncharacterized repeat protein (TIGR03803 family)